MNRILIVEDEVPIAQLIEMSLARAGYQCEAVNDGCAAADKIEQNDYDLVLLDIMLPGLDGYELLEYLRPMGTPVIFITAKGTLGDRVRGLNLGADDYITKPYSLKELAARVYAQIRRNSMKGFVIDHQNQLLQIDNRIIPLAQKEFELFLFLLGNSGRILSAAELYQEVWRTGKADAANTVAVHITRLRHKLEETESVIGRIETVRGEGYRFLPRSEAGIRL